MEVKEEKLPEKMIPVFTVLKNGAILKNIFIVNSRDFSSPERNSSTSRDDNDDEAEETLIVGRHPDCDILLTHPSISRFHFEIRSFPSRRKLFLTDLSSVHGTWVTDQKVEPGGCVEVKEGDVIRIGGSTRIYRLHWIPLSRAYDIDSPFVSPLDAITAMEQEKENRILEAEELLEIARQPLANAALGDDRDLHLDVTSEGTGSSAPSDEDISVTTRDILLPLQPLANTASGDDRNLHLDVTSEGTGSSVPSEDEDISVTTEEILLPLASPSVLTRTRDSELKLDEDLQISTIRDLDFVDSAAEKPSSSCSQSKQDQSGGTPEDLGCSELDSAAEAGDRDLHLDVTSEGTGSSVPSEDEDVSVTLASPSLLILTRDSEQNFSEDVQGSTKWDLDVESVAEKPTSNSCSESEQQQIGGTPEDLDCSELDSASETDEFDDRGNEGLHLNVMSECMESAVTYVDEDLYLSARKTSSLQPLTGTIVVETVVLTEDVQASPELAISSSERMESPVTYGDEDQYLAAKNTSSLQAPTDTIVVETLQLTEDVQASPELAVNILESNAGNPSSGCSTSKGQNDCCFEASSCSAFDLATDVGILSTGETKFFTTEVSCETLTKAEIQCHEDSEETESRVEILAEEIQGLVISEVQSKMAIETESENLHQESNGEAKVGSRQASPVSDCLLAGNEHQSRINAEDTQSLCVSWQALNTSEVGAPSEIWSEVKPAEDQNPETGMTKETENIFGEGSSECLSEELKDNDGTQSLFLTPIQKPVTECAIGSRRSEESYSLSKTKSEAYTDKGSPFFSILAAETFEDTEPVEEPTSESTGSQESKILQARPVRDDELSEMDSTKSSPIGSSTCNIWSRRGKADSILQLRTNKSEGKQKRNGKQPKGQSNRKQTITDKSISLAVHHVAEMLEPEIFTPDKENLTPTSHMLKRLHEIGDIKDNKSSLKLSGKSSSSLKTPSSLAVVTSGKLTEPEIFTPNKENLTPNSHMLKRLRDVGDIKETKGSSSKAIRKPFFDMHVEENVMAEQRPTRYSTNSKSKVKKHEPVEPKRKIERAPFQPLFEKSSPQNQSYADASSTALARNKLSRGIRSSSILSDAKSKTKWTIVLDTSSLLDKESRKPLHLLQGLKGTHLVVPRTVFRELNETKRGGSLIFGRRRREIASSALDWIEECKVNTKWWIQIQCSSEETKATAPTPPVTPQSSSAFPFSLPDIDSPTSEDQVLECALLYRNRNSDEKLVVLSNDVTLKIKAMAEGVICETAQEFYESLANPLSERFMWRESLPRGRTWSQQDDVVLREKFRNNGSSGAKGLKLILLHNSHYGHI